MRDTTVWDVPFSGMPSLRQKINSGVSFLVKSQIDIHSGGIILERY